MSGEDSTTGSAGTLSGRTPDDGRTAHLPWEKRHGELNQDERRNQLGLGANIQELVLFLQPARYAV
jgi:hypothetical protein